ncbi:MAG: hypothetical protein ACREE4_23705 [Stellaceae bacterium]
MRWAAAFALVLFAGLAPAIAAPHSACRQTPLVLWGDGQHDDTAALNAWLSGDTVIWAESGKPVGATIAGHTFRLSAAIYVPSGTGRTLTRFRLVWPWTHEEVSGGTIAAGTNPDAPPVESGVRKIGGDRLEGIPYPAPATAQPRHRPRRACLMS